MRRAGRKLSLVTNAFRVFLMLSM
ncbi:hypothetical protein Godav_016822 [Gossypium davidsonii]|uniref:Uncharacterized protein n=1 Tax=Gossypium davidsonii TaxID=34287 RepID=A0A7J8QSN5_GOSDV|nr:hypothetical protein [Gossypium davidsonii]